jgi:hypothetical protein
LEIFSRKQSSICYPIKFAYSDVNGAHYDVSGDLYLSTLGNFSVSGLIGTGSDIFVCSSPTLGPNTACSAFTLFFDGSTVGWGGEVTDAFDVED